MAPSARDFRKVKAAAAGRSRKTKNWQCEYALWIGGAGGSILVACVVLMVNPNRGPFEIPVNDANLLKHANRNAKSWRANAASFFNGWTIGHIRLLDGVGISQMGGSVAPCVVPETPVPDQFDARTKWPQCFKSKIYSMGNCTASWAIATTSALSNRFCISDPGSYSDLMLSPQQLLSCDTANRGCRGGDIDAVWKFIETYGLVSEDCFPYDADSDVPCRKQCTTEKPLKAASHCLLNREDVVRREIFLNGPVVAPIFLVDDFLTYAGGLYQEMPTATQLITMDARRQKIIHAVKILGWGDSNGKPYWVIENSWGEDWGEKGFAKVLRGGNPEKKGEGIVIENYMMAGTPASRLIRDVDDVDEDDAESQERSGEDEDGM